MTQRNNSQHNSGLITVVALFFGFAFLLGGLFLIGRSWSVTGAEFWVFLSGILCCSFAYFIPAHILKFFDGV